VTVPKNQNKTMWQVTQLSPLSCYCTDLSSPSHTLSWNETNWFHALWDSTPLT